MKIEHLDDRVHFKNDNGQLHRVDGPAVIMNDGSSKHWYFNGKRHRVDGPAVEFSDGCFQWWRSGHPHSVSGPAMKFKDETVSYYLHGRRFSTKEEWFLALPKEDQVSYLFNMESK